jgi:hypothetical protein
VRCLAKLPVRATMHILTWASMNDVTADRTVPACCHAAKWWGCKYSRCRCCGHFCWTVSIRWQFISDFFAIFICHQLFLDLNSSVTSINSLQNWTYSFDRNFNNKLKCFFPFFLKARRLNLNLNLSCCFEQKLGVLLKCTTWQCYIFPIPYLIWQCSNLFIQNSHLAIWQFLVCWLSKFDKG